MIPKPPEHVATIADNAQLAAFAARMHKAPWLAVDTEFKRERTYYPELCLVQIAGQNEIGLIDMLAVSDLGPLTDLIGTAGPLKVFHAADQDIEVLHQTLDTIPAPVFDTQIAAALAGLGDQIGYAGLVEALTGTALAKAHTRTDWSKRPLSQQEMAYAADDVRYLAIIYPMLRDRLQSLGRMHWAEADSTALADAEHLAIQPHNAWQRVKAWRRLEPAEQQVLAALSQWREEQAMHDNRPRKWILSDDALVALAQSKPDNHQTLENIKSLPSKTARRHGAALLATIGLAAQYPATPLAPAGEPLDDAQKKCFKKARRALAICARVSGIPAPTLAKRKELEQLVAGQRDLPMLKGWRAEVAGETIVEVVEGRMHIDGKDESARLVESANWPAG